MGGFSVQWGIFRSRRLIRVAFPLVLGLVLAVLMIGTAAGMTMSTIVSTDQNGNFVYGPSDLTPMASSMSGRYVAFTGYNPVLGALVWVKDTETGAVDYIGGAETSGGYDASISADGRFVAFTTGYSEIKVVDRTGVQSSVLFTAGTGDFCSHPSISGDGKRVAFVSNAGGTDQVYVKDLSTGALILASTNDAGNLPNSASIDPVISANGNKVAFWAGNFPGIPASGFGEIYLKDIAPLFSGTLPLVGTLQVVSQSAWDDNSEGAASISADGTIVAYQSYRGPTWGTVIYVKNTISGDLLVASADANGNEVWNGGYRPSISHDGRYIAFMSLHDTWQAGNTHYEIFRKDMVAGTLDIVSTGDQGQVADDSSWIPSISGNGNWVAFKSFASNLFRDAGGNIIDTNGVSDVYAMRASPAQTAAIVIGEGGGDCVSIGTWDDISRTCTMDQDLFASGRGVMIESDGVTLNGNGHLIQSDGSPASMMEDGIYVPAAKDVTISNVTVEGFKYGVYLGWTENAQVSGVTASNNSTGIKLQTATGTIVNGSLITASTVGIDVDPSDYNSFTGNTLNGNDVGILCDGSFNIFGHNNFIGNWTQAEVISGSGNDFTGNYWSDAMWGMPYNFGSGEDPQPLSAPTCDYTTPDLGIRRANIYWLSYADYMDRIVTVDYLVNNLSGTATANDVSIVGSVSTNGVTLAGGVPWSLGKIEPGLESPVTLKYNVPVGVVAFRTTTYATARDGCGNLLYYPGQMPM